MASFLWDVLGGLANTAGGAIEGYGADKRERIKQAMLDAEAKRAAKKAELDRQLKLLELRDTYGARGIGEVPYEEAVFGMRTPEIKTDAPLKAKTVADALRLRSAPIPVAEQRNLQMLPTMPKSFGKRMFAEPGQPTRSPFEQPVDETGQSPFTLDVPDTMRAAEPTKPTNLDAPFMAEPTRQRITIPGTGDLPDEELEIVPELSAESRAAAAKRGEREDARKEALAQWGREDKARVDAAELANQRAVTAAEILAKARKAEADADRAAKGTTETMKSRLNVVSSMLPSVSVAAELLTKYTPARIKSLSARGVNLAAVGAQKATEGYGGALMAEGANALFISDEDRAYAELIRPIADAVARRNEIGMLSNEDIARYLNQLSFVAGDDESAKARKVARAVSWATWLKDNDRAVVKADLTPLPGYMGSPDVSAKIVVGGKSWTRKP